MLPAPTTIATSTSCARTSRTWLAIRSICAGSVPYSRSPIRASPEIFSSMRLNRAEANGRTLLLPHLEAREAGDAYVLARLGRDLGAQVLDRLALVLLLVEVLLIEEDELGGPLLQLPLDDLLHDVVRLAVGLRLILQDAALVRHLLLGDVVQRDVLRVHRSDVDRDLARELLEVVVQGDEVRLAKHLDKDADALLLALSGAAHVRIRGDHALRGAAPAALGGRSGPLLAEDLDGLGLVAPGLLESLLHVHHRRARLLAQGLHLCCGHRHQDSPPLWVGAGSAAGSSSSVCGGCGISIAASRFASSWDPWRSCGLVSPSPCGWGLSSPVSLSASACFWVSACLAAACAFASASAFAFASASAFAFSSASCLAFSSASRRLRSSSSRRLRSSSSARRFSSAARQVAAAPSIDEPRPPTIRSQERIASSLPGITYRTGLGSQLESTRPMIGISRRSASRRAISSVFRSMMITASGMRCMSATPPRLYSSLRSSASIDMRSFVGSRSSRPPSFSSRSSCRRWIRLRIVLKLVSSPPSQRRFTYGIWHRSAHCSTESRACFLVPTNRITPPFAATSVTKSVACFSSSSVWRRSMM